MTVNSRAMDAATDARVTVGRDATSCPSSNENETRGVITSRPRVDHALMSSTERHPMHLTLKNTAVATDTVVLFVGNVSVDVVVCHN